MPMWNSSKVLHIHIMKAHTCTMYGDQQHKHRRVMTCIRIAEVTYGTSNRWLAKRTSYVPYRSSFVTWLPSSAYSLLRRSFLGPLLCHFMLQCLFYVGIMLILSMSQLFGVTLEHEVTQVTEGACLICRAQDTYVLWTLRSHVWCIYRPRHWHNK